ncbi:MAG: double-strand break repair protein AddB [Candidatus Paracaedimonas acanthamoebae]|uniref:Double-strand break repair protein AddB n=1 Tax=Candidatus Paracaedimonas acanthamoebae TaxID=244581 RepID=A0A8J7PYN0_9PROT|nr:double-strand break repair protein AddB [Candidatus Paracaedimonas acanthamoebae]
MLSFQTLSKSSANPLKQLAWQLYHSCQEEPLEVSKALVFLPSRRAKRQFIEELQNLFPGNTFILPQVTTLRDWATQADNFLGKLLPPVSFFERELHFINFLKPYVREESQANQFAESLSSLHDEFIFAEIPFERARKLTPEAFAAHWQENLKYLEIIQERWPRFLRQIKRSDPCIHFVQFLNLQIEAWKQNPLQIPVIAAGFEEDIPVVQRFIAAIEQLPKGKVYRENCWNSLEEKTLINLFSAETSFSQDEKQGAATRTETLTQKFHLREFSSLEEEARVIALLMREQLEESDKTIALITPLRALAERVISELARWNLNIDDSYGKNLSEIPLGLFFRHSLNCVLKDFESISFLSLLKHPYMAQIHKTHIEKLEIQHLRGRLFSGNIFSLLKEIPKGTELYNFLLSLQEGASSLKYLLSQQTIRLKDLVEAHVQFIKFLSSDTVEDYRGYKEFTSQLKGLDRALSHLKIKGTDYPLVLEKLLNQVTLRPSYGVHPRLHIWGPLEAQLQTVDYLIIGGMNEKNWPGNSQQSPWLNEGMRTILGLPTRAKWYELKKNLWVNLLRAPEVILTRALREEGQIEPASRWWLELLAKLKAKGQYETHYLSSVYQQWAKILDHPLEQKILFRPAPCPPLEARPRTLSVTQIETWIRDPYSIYAREILKLKPLDPLEPGLSPALFGVMIHQILETFFKQGNAVQDEQAHEILSNLGKNTFNDALSHPVVASFWWTRFNRLITWFLGVERTLIPTTRFVEARGEIFLEGPFGLFKLKATADRIDLNEDGTACLIDYKTGRLPTRKEIDQGIKPQLPLEAAILQRGGFQGIDSHRSIVMRYMHLSGGQPAGMLLDMAEGDLVEKALKSLQEMINEYDDPKKPYASCPILEIAPSFSPYHHLSRIQEWQGL